ncbi:hypothetical protein ACFOZ7_14595 [Natribaculum luteum]|uniref:ATP-dependent zinc protease domain-containing protein n=1 Tax=Natribaculum luteum TaxID=1586232 RepID=A0ABD5P2C5_9EURY|nr:hypothetical protein [Natribaculum luteum]
MPEISQKEQVTFKGMNGKTTVTAKADVGADRTTIDHKVAARIGAGPVVSSVKVNGSDRRPVAKVWVELKDVEKLVEVSLSDREEKSTEALLGKPFLKHFQIQVET